MTRDAVAETAVRGDPPRFRLAAWEARYPVRAGITGRGTPGAPFDLGLGDTRTPGPEWSRLAGQFVGFTGIVVGRQVHGAEVAWHDDRAAGMTVLSGLDGHATRTGGLMLAVTLADCIPVYLFAPDVRAVALLHCGWRGIAAGMLERGIDVLEARAGARPAAMVMHCGVGICGACYEVGSEVFSALGLTGPPGRARLDLRTVLERRALDAGVGTVTLSSRCSAHEPETFFSHRLSAGRDGRMIAYLGLLPGC